MALAPFFDRVYGAVGGHLAVSRETLSALLASNAVGISCGTNLTPNDVWISELTVNLMARIYPRLSITGPRHQVSRLKAIANSINPNIEFVDTAPRFTSVFIGKTPEGGSIAPSASGWVAHIYHSALPPQGPDNPYAAGAAAALACGELFRRIFLQVSREHDLALSLLDFGTESGARRELNAGTVGKVIFVGVGAVGNAGVWALARDRRTKGNLLLVDPEDMTLLNLQRYVLGTVADVSHSKVALAKRALKDSQFAVEEHQLTLEKFADSRKGVDIPTICISVDNEDGRRSAQALLPRLVVNGWTGDRALGVSWHILSRKAACLACLYQPHGQAPSATEQAARALGLTVERATLLWITRQPISDDDLETAAKTLGVDPTALSPWRGKPLGDFYTEVICGSVPLDIKGVGRVETVPLAHQSALAGILMAAELVKRTNPMLRRLAQSEPLASWDDVLLQPPTLWTRPRPREAGCICGDPDFQGVYRRKWGGRKQTSKLRAQKRERSTRRRRST